MKKIISFMTVLAMILSMFSFVSVTAEDGKVIVSYSFEDEKESWGPWSNKGVEFTTVTDECSTDGKKALMVNDTDPVNATGMRSGLVEIEGGKKYTALADMFLVYGNVKFYIRYCDSERAVLKSKYASGIERTWSNVVLTLEAPAEAVYAEIYIATGGSTTGLAFFDNLKLVEGQVGATVPNGTIPKNLPELPKEDDSPLVPVDDGIKEGTVIYSYSFEDGLSPWGYQTTNSEPHVKLITDADKVSDGKKSIHIFDEGAGIAPGIRSPMVNVSEGNYYSYTVDALCTGNIAMYVRFYDESGSQIFNKSGKIPTGSWQNAEVVFQAPKKAKTTQLIVCGNVAGKGEVYVDNAKITKSKYIEDTAAQNDKFVAPKQVPAVNATLVAPVNNKLVYNPYNENGDKISDFSYGGFYAGEYELPESANIPVAMELSPSGTDDDTALIQEAIDKVFSESTDISLKKIVLKAGTYNINKTGIRLKSGIVLSGEGQGPTGTVLFAKDPVQHMVIRIEGQAPTDDTFHANILDNYLTSGSRTFSISEEDAKNFKVGDSIVLCHPATDEWAAAINMTNMKNNTDGDSSWGGLKQNKNPERKITAINGGQITVDFGLFIPYMKELSQCYIYKTDDSNTIQNVGVENLRIRSYYNGISTDEQHATVGVKIQNAKNIFVRDYTGKHFYGSVVSCGARTKQVTVQNVSSIEPISKITGSRRYTFACSTSAQQILVTGCYSSKGRHDYETSFEVNGPINFVDSVADESYGGIETHGTWSTGILYDNVYSISNTTVASIGFKNHGIYGSGESQGWTAATAIAWNCLAPAIIVHKPPLYQNFMVGSWGIYADPAGVGAKKTNIDRYTGIYRTSKDWKAIPEVHFATKEGSPFVGDGYAEAEFTPVEPRSLFRAQLSERYTGVISNARPTAPIIINPKYDTVANEAKIVVEGISQLGASKVTVYIDDKPYDAKINEDNSFVVETAANQGVHKIYATQTINGVESTKNADRFITIGSEDAHQPYLSSIYDRSKTSAIINDPRMTFDAYEAIQSGVKVVVNGKRLYSDVDPFIENGRTLVPMRAIFEVLNAEVNWDAATETATATKSGVAISLTRNQTTAYINGNPFTLDVPAATYSGRFMVPVRFISESLGAKVEWDEKTWTVKIEAAQ